MDKNRKGTEKRRGAWHVVLLSIVMLVFSLLCWILFVKQMATGTSQETDVSPASCIDKIDCSLDNMEARWYENMFEKSLLSKIDSVATYFMTGEIASSQVLKGSGPWLFYKSTSDGDPIGDYEGTSQYEESWMNETMEKVTNVQQALNERGINFTIMVAPNKENIYSEHMPDTYTQGESSRTDNLINCLKNGGISVVSPKEELLALHESQQLYYSYDTHWNQLGAYIGVKKALESWTIQLPELADREITETKLKGNYHYCGEDDLAKMAGLRFYFNDEIEYEVNGTQAMDWGQFQTQQEAQQVSHFTNPDAIIRGSVLLVGDSFRSSMIPSLREVFADVYVVHRSYYNASLLDEIQPNYLLAEYVERYSGDLNSIDSFIHYEE